MSRAEKKPEIKDYALKHSAAHLLAMAVKELYPKVQLAIGPPIEDGFYYDFGNVVFHPEDLVKIEEKMRELSKKNFPITKHEKSKQEAKKILSKEPFKLELLDEISGEITFYQQGDFIDLCEGPHVKSTGEVRHFKLTKLAAAYWKGDSKNTQLQRIYGIVFNSDKELQAYLKQQEEAEKRDHRKLGKEMKLFTFADEIGPGLPLWLPKGETIRNILIQFMREIEIKNGYQYVRTPEIAESAVYKATGHLPYYRDSMYAPIIIENHEYYLRPMNCAHHHMLYKQLVQSYRDLPLRLAEAGTVYRSELSGVMYGLIRVRGFTQNDSHIYITENQLKKEFLNVLKLFKEVYNIMGIKDYWFRLSLPDFEKSPEKFAGDVKVWEKASSVIREAMKEFGAKYVEDIGEAAFYGPKIDVQIKSVIGKEDTIATVQVDILVPQRLGLVYDDEHGRQAVPLVIHRAILGSFERFVGFLLEEYAGRLPLWLSPVHVRLVNLTERNLTFMNKVGQQMRDAGLRVEIDDRNDTINKKVRAAEVEKIPFIVTVGDKEEEKKTLAVRDTRTGKVTFGVKTEDFIKDLQREISEKKLPEVKR